MTKTVNAILVDDEERARNVLSALLASHCPQINLMDQCKNVKEAVESIKTHQPDVVFLDIEMPEHAGYEIINFFDEINFEIIFITAYDQYAIKAFEMSALDYLLKPIEISRLKTAISKLEEKLGSRKMEENYRLLLENMEKDKIDKIVIPHNREQLILPLEKIVALEAKESYSVIHTNENKNYMVSRNLKHFESLLDESNFFRSHKSWLINMDKVQSYSKKQLEITLEGGLTTKLSKYKKPNFEKEFS